jgi:PleD family two-component response regulator
MSLGGPTPLVLGAPAFHGRLSEELGRIQRSGGFLSLGMVGLPSPRGPAAAPTLAAMAERLRTRVRGYDAVALLGDRLAVLMPGTDMSQAVLAMKRLLPLGQEGVPGPPASAGVASVYGQVECGVDALPQAAEEALGAAKSPGEIKRSDTLTGRPRVLVVDDDPTFAAALADTLLERDWEAHPSTDSGDAIQRIREGTYCALFVDLVMPNRGGLDLLREAMTRSPRPPAVLMSGSDPDRDLVVEALSLGAVTFVSKPIRSVDLDTSLQLFRALLPGAARRM